MGLPIRMIVFCKVTHCFAIYLQFGHILASKYVQSSKILFYCRKFTAFAAFVIIVIIQHIFFILRSVSQRNAGRNRND